MIRLLIAEDSATVQRVLSNLLENEKHIEIVGVASNGEQAVEMCHRLKPDLITMDIFMPGMNGLEATRRIMTECPTPIVIISAMVGTRDANFSFEAMRAGAIEVIEKPTGILAGKYQEIKRSLIQIIEKSVHANPDALMSWLPTSPPSSPDEKKKQEEKPKKEKRAPRGANLTDCTPELICIGGSTGAPTVIVEILSRLPADFPVPIIVAQHITRGFAARMAVWLNASIALDVKMATADAKPKPGTVLLCPDDEHLRLTAARRVALTPVDEPQPKVHVPNIDMLFSSAAAVYKNKVLGVILSGMGKDGAEGLQLIKEYGGCTIAQNEKTSVVYGMNKVAGELGAVDVTLPPHDIAQTLRLAGKNL